MYGKRKPSTPQGAPQVRSKSAAAQWRFRAPGQEKVVRLGPKHQSRLSVAPRSSASSAPRRVLSRPRADVRSRRAALETKSDQCTVAGLTLYIPRGLAT